jgi:hypothetical protein
MSGMEDAVDQKNLAVNLWDTHGAETMPYASAAQRGYFHANPEKVGPAVVKEFDAASKGQRNLPQHVQKFPRDKSRLLSRKKKK